jgi:flagellar hook protein FlgE
VHSLGTAPSPSTGAGTGQGNAIQINGWPAGNNSTNPQTIGLDFSNMAALAGTPTANVLAQNGYAAGTLSNITVGQDGSIVGSFTNGQQKTLAQVALATFQNEGGLHRAGGNFFVQTANSGLAQVGAANSGRYGAIVAGSLEQSNVSLADEFTKMIVAQRAFEANTRGISTADQNMMDVLNIRASEN